MTTKILVISLATLFFSSCGSKLDKLKGGGSFKYIFVSAATSNGSLGGISGADAICNSDAERPDTTVTYKAMLVDTAGARVACTTANCSGGNAEHVDWILAPNTEYRRVDGTTIIGTTNSLALFSYPLTNGLDTDATLIYWTGFNNAAADFTTSDTSNTCTSWTSGAGGGALNGKRGNGNSNYGAFGSGQDWCNVTYHLACVQQ